MKITNLLFTSILGLVFCPHLLATNLQISDPILYFDNEQAPKALFAQLTVSWENAWHNARNHDAIWLCFKFIRNDDNGYAHAAVKRTGHEIIQAYGAQQPELAFKAPADQTGLFLYPNTSYRGPIRVKIKIELDLEKLGRFRPQAGKLQAYGLEMVYIPEGPFTLGDPGDRALDFSAFFRSDAAGKPDGLYTVVAEDKIIQIGAEAGHLYYFSQNQYRGDQKGVLGINYPKGFRSFYIMKYEPTQGLYADFLNSLGDTQSQLRANFAGKGYYQKRGSIRISDNKYIADHPHRPNNFMGWDDAAALADWLALRPMTELEFTKACRGPEKPEAVQYPWGTSSKSKLERLVNEEGNLVLANGWEESELDDDNRAFFGASHYWVMDLAGSLWERVITVGDSIGRAFTGSHGDGQISYYGFATNEDWPKGDAEIGGFGYRGGGFYTSGRPYAEFNPYSPIAYRPYGAWAGGDRTEAYGARFVRTDE